jgi:integrase
MSVRKRTWTTKTGETKEAWVVAYTGQDGRRHLQTFDRKKQADDYHHSVKVDVRRGIHTAPAKSVTVKEAARAWLAGGESAWERATHDTYTQHVELHIVPYLGRVKLAQLTVPVVREFEDKLRLGAPAPGEEKGSPRSDAMVRKIRITLGAILGDAQERGLVAQNVVRSLRKTRQRRRRKDPADQNGAKLRAGVDIPTPAEIKAIVTAATGRWRPLPLTVIFTGLRASEMRGLTWGDVDLKKSELHVRQRADKYNAMGKPKSEAGERTIPLPPIVVDTLREWKLACPKSGLGLVFPNGQGRVESYSNIVQRGLAPTLIRAGVTVPLKDADGNLVRDEDGKPIVEAKYAGLHAFRHFYASWCINRKSDGGLELPAKTVQARLGHASIGITLDRYGHLFPRGDDGAELAAAERALLG